MAVKNLKILLSGDSKPFTQSINKANVSMGGFKKQTNSALDTIASKFGVNTSAIRGNIQTFGGGLKALSAGFKGAAKSSGLLSKAMNVLKIALISTGIGALIVGLGLALAALISYFQGSQRGADKLAVFMAQLGAAVAAVKDRFIAFGEGLYMMLTGKWKAGADQMRNAFKGLGDEIKVEAKQSGDLEKRLQALRDKEIALITVLGERKRKVAELRLAGEDENKTLEQRKAAIEEAARLERANVADQIAMQKERVAITAEQVGMGESMADELRALEEERNKLNEIEEAGDKAVKRLAERYNSLTHEIEAHTTALINDAKAQEEAFLQEGGVTNNKINTDVQFTGQVQGLELAPPSVQPHIDAADQIQRTYVDAGQVINEALQRIATDFGVTIGQMIAGEADASQLGTVIVGAMADMAIQIGQLAIGAGLAKMAIDKALVTFGGGFGAVAAGIALVALGTAVKSSLAKAAAGGAGGGGTIPSGSGRGAYTGPQSEKQKIEITINGEFRAKGNELIQVLNKENVRLNTV